MTTIETTRRAVVWGVPVVAFMAAAPAFAASAPPITLRYVDAIKCPGEGRNDKSYLFHFVADSAPLPGSIVVKTLTVNGVAVQTQAVTIEGLDVYVRSVSRDNSADANGTIAITYTSGMPPSSRSLSFNYRGTHPDNDLCGRLA